MSNRFDYKCDDCGFVFKSNLSKLDILCIKCRSTKVDYYKDNEVIEESIADEQEPMTTNKEEPILPAQAGYYKALVAKKYEENTGLKEQRGWLLEQVYFLRKAVKFLETRKKELEDGIYGLEKNITIGISIMEQLEENKEFQQLSKKTEKVNK